MSEPQRIDLARELVGSYVAGGIWTAMCLVDGWALARVRGPLWANVLAVALMLLVWAALLASMLGNLRVYFSDRGIHAPRLFGRGERFFAWSEVDRIGRFNFTLHLYAGRQRIEVNTITFKDRAALGRLLQERLANVRWK
jgi:hypothetical protein